MRSGQAQTYELFHALPSVLLLVRRSRNRCEGETIWSVCISASLLLHLTGHVNGVLEALWLLREGTHPLQASLLSILGNAAHFACCYGMRSHLFLLCAW